MFDTSSLNEGSGLWAGRVKAQAFESSGHRAVAILFARASFALRNPKNSPGLTA